ncbi:hypothetical protein EBT31_14655 [bacterium]|nr:hypothetical protein [bacterium]
MLRHFEKLIEDRRRQIGEALLDGVADSYEKYQWHVGYSSGMLAALQLLKEIVDADADSEERG